MKTKIEFNNKWKYFKDGYYYLCIFNMYIDLSKAEFEERTEVFLFDIEILNFNLTFFVFKNNEKK